jgi:hypothetical protein
MFTMALIHTFPFIVHHIWKGDMVKMWNTMVVYWTGVVALIAQTYLTFASLGPLRRWSYEFFKYSHFVAAAIFIFFFFLHCDFRLTSWYVDQAKEPMKTDVGRDYFIATGVIYVSTLLYSLIKTYLIYGWSHKAIITPMACGLIQVKIPVHPGGTTHSTVPLNISWHPGQHIFIRFLTLGLHTFSAHPFSICSLPHRKNKREPSDLVLYIQPQDGFTKRLSLLAKKNPGMTIPIMLDGPYGGLGVKTLADFDRAVIVVGGSGAGFSLPIVEDILFQKDFKGRGGPGRVTRIQVVLATRSHEVRAWYAHEIQRMFLQYISAEFLQVEIYITNKNAPPAVDEKFNILRDARMDQPTFANGSRSGSSSYGEDKRQTEVTYRPNISTSLAVLSGRPDIGRIIEESTATPFETIGVAVCGPAGIVFEVREAAALAQNRVLAGKGASEVYLHSESFS